jgi:hypothetical protein
MTTDREIKRLAQEVTPHYCYGTPYYLNTQTDRMRAKRQMPACLHIQTADGSMATSATPYFTADVWTRRVQVGFADAIKFDQDPEKTLDTVEALLGMCRELIAKMNASGLWQPVESFSYQVLYNTQDGNLVWVLMDFSVTEQPRCTDAV